MKGPIINGKQYTLVVFRVLEWDEQSRPLKCEIGYEEASFTLSENRFENEFMTGFIPVKMTKPAQKQ